MVVGGGARGGDFGGALMSGEEEEECRRCTLVRKERRLGKPEGKRVR